MGDIGSHAEISHFVIGQVRKILPDAIPAADYAFLELGNFLTDVSQFRDPPSYHRAREQARSEAGFGGISVPGSGDWVTDIFGQNTPGQVHGALPEMFRLLMAAVTHLVFDNDALPRAGSLVSKAPIEGPSILLDHGIQPDDVDWVLKAYFTQYFPHEHLDATPLPPGQVASLQGRPEFTRGPRGLLAYLDDDLVFLSEQLTSLEADWRGARARGPKTMGKITVEGGLGDFERRIGLARLGHILHAVEDYFFHSNLPEAHAWAAARAGKAGQNPSRAELLSAALHRTAHDGDTVPLLRLLNRRLRYPVYDGPGTLSATQSEDATGLVYTGGFGQTDVWHTLGGALEALEAQLERLPLPLPPEYDPRNTSLVLFKMLLSQRARAEMVAGKTLDAQRKLHLKQLRGGEYHKKIKKIQEIAKEYPVCEHTVKALLDAFDLDLKVSEKHSGVLVDFPGPGAVLITMMNTMETEREASEAAQKGLDATPASVGGLASGNGCSAENIGTHTLMAKDATSKEPLREEAVALAKHASASIAVKFLSSVTRSPAPVGEGVDWDAALAFFVRDVVPAGWETELMTAVRQPGFRQPDVTAPHDQPHYALLGPQNDPDRLAARRGHPMTTRLEDYYRSLES